MIQCFVRDYSFTEGYDTSSANTSLWKGRYYGSPKRRSVSTVYYTRYHYQQIEYTL